MLTERIILSKKRAYKTYGNTVLYFRKRGNVDAAKHWEEARGRVESELLAAAQSLREFASKNPKSDVAYRLFGMAEEIEEFIKENKEITDECPT